MQLNRLQLSRGWQNNGPLTGEIEFGSPSGKTSLNLTEEQCTKILSICANALTEQTRFLAEEMTAQIINVKQIKE